MFSTWRTQNEEQQNMKKWEKVNSETKITKLSALFACVWVWCWCVRFCLHFGFFVVLHKHQCWSVWQTAKFFSSFLDSSKLKKFYGGRIICCCCCLCSVKFFDFCLHHIFVTTKKKENRKSVATC